MARACCSLGWFLGLQFSLLGWEGGGQVFQTQVRMGRQPLGLLRGGWGLVVVCTGRGGELTCSFLFVFLIHFRHVSHIILWGWGGLLEWLLRFILGLGGFHRGCEVRRLVGIRLSAFYLVSFLFKFLHYGLT